MPLSNRSFIYIVTIVSGCCFKSNLVTSIKSICWSSRSRLRNSFPLISRSIVNFYNCIRYRRNRLRGNIDTCTFSRWGCNAIRIRNVCSSCYTSSGWQYIQTKFCRSYCQISCTCWLIDFISFISDFNRNRRCFWFNICNRNVLRKTTLI